IIEKYQKQNPKIIKWLKEKDSGISNARNIGIKYSTGDLIGFLGADDILHKDFFEKIPYYTSTIKNFDALYFNRYSISPNRCEFKHSSSIPFSKKNLIK